MSDDLQQLRRRFARNVPVYYLFYAVSGFLIWMPIWVIYLQELRGMTLTQIATIESIFWITVVLAEVPTGAVADRWGRRGRAIPPRTAAQRGRVRRSGSGPERRVAVRERDEQTRLCSATCSAA